MLFSDGQGFFSHFRQRGRRGVCRYIKTHNAWIPAELRGACSEYSKSLSWIFFQVVAGGLGEPRKWMENSTFVLSFFHRVARSALLCFPPFRSPARCTAPPAQLFLPCLLFATTQLHTASRNSSSSSASVCRTPCTSVAPNPGDVCRTPRTEHLKHLA